MFPNCKFFTHHTYCFSYGNVLLSVYDFVLSHCSCYWAFSVKSRNRRIPEQACEPNSYSRAHSALQAQATQPLCKCLVHYILDIYEWIELFIGPYLLLSLFAIGLASWLADQKLSQQASNMWWSSCGRQEEMEEHIKSDCIHSNKRLQSFAKEIQIKCIILIIIFIAIDW